ncbi:ACP S-malonyltransferase [Quadrisphaera sp. KR29]|uniref:ACP S-malonyltransferase n=1 Tax=Quadrisphaera sp. KR29 TaxID=3461391 RepID=UPI004043EB12
MLALVCPGQGSQAPGMLAPWLEVPGVADHLRWASAVVGPVAGGDLLAHGTTSDAGTIRDTAVAQPLIVAAGLAAAAALWPGGVTGDVVLAGHSVGELTAAALAGALTPEAALVLVRERGRAMAAAATTTSTGMSAVVGGRPEEVAAALGAAGLTAANHNAAGQVVAAGTAEQLAALAAAPPPRARVIPLQVAGAFHTEHMAPAREQLAALAPGVPTTDPVLPLLSNADGAAVADGREVLARIVTQVANPVRWDLCSDALAARGVTALLELSPAGTLTGLAKRALPGVELLALKGPDDLEAARELLARHATPQQAPQTPQPTQPRSDPA